jgi:hypothetical protein
MPKSLPRDTPVDTPAVTTGGALIDGAELGPDPEVLGARALARARSVETLEVAYEAWDELRREAKVARARWKEEKERLSQQGSLLLGAVKFAQAPAAGEGLAKLDGFVAEAQGKLEAAQRELESRVEAAERVFTGQLLALREELTARVERQAAVSKPVFKLVVRVLPGERRVLHVRRLGQDEAVVALFALNRRVPSRYDYLSDDSTDALGATPPVLYADEGVAEVRPTASALAAALAAQSAVWPVKGMLPVQFPDGGFMRWMARGAVLEAEVIEGDGFRSVLSAAEAERVTGLLLAHKLAGRIELELVRD